MQTTSYLYRPALKKAFDVTKKARNLWFFGLFAVLVSAGGEYEMISRVFYNADDDRLINSFIAAFQSGWQEGLGLVGGSFWSNFGQLIVSNPAALAQTLFALLFIVVLTLFVIWLSVASQIALIRGCSLAGRAKRLLIGEGLEYANVNFWPVFLIVAILKIALFALFGLLGWELMLLSAGWISTNYITSFWELMLLGAGWVSTTIYIISFVVFVLAVLVVSFILKYQTFFILLKRQKFAVAFNSAWQLFKSNWLISLEMALIMFAVYLLSAAVSAFIITFFSGIPLVIIPFYFFGMAPALKVIISAVAVILMVVGVLLVTAIMTTFQWAGWTALFECLAGDDDGMSKLERWGEELKQLPEVILGR